MGFKKTLCIDFDGVLNSYKSGWQGIDVISDPPVDGAIEWLRSLVRSQDDEGNPHFEVCIYSSRSKELKGIGAMQRWLFDYGLVGDDLGELNFPTQKPAAWLTIDDRAICFDGTWPSIDAIDSFVPWNKKKIVGPKDMSNISMSAEAPLEQAFGPRFRALRKASGKSLGEAAALLRMSVVQLSDIERGTGSLFLWQIDMMAQLAAAHLHQLAAEAQDKSR